MTNRGSPSIGVRDSYMRNTWWLLVSAILLAGVSACGTNHSLTSGLSTSSRPCTLMSRSDAQDLLGEKVTVSARPGECTYVSKPGTYISVDVSLTPQEASNVRQFMSAYAHLPGSAVATLDGTPTLWIPYPQSTGGGGRLTSIRDGTAIEITVTMGVPEPLSVANKGMALVFGQLSMQH